MESVSETCIALPEGPSTPDGTNVTWLRTSVTPLASDDRDMVVDLHTAFTRSYDQGGFSTKIDYQRDPAVALNDEDRAWLDDLLKQHKVRQ